MKQQIKFIACGEKVITLTVVLMAIIQVQYLVIGPFNMKTRSVTPEKRYLPDWKENNKLAESIN